MDKDSQGLALGGHDGSFLVVDRVARSDCVVAIRGPDGEVLSAYLTNVDIEKLVEFLGQKVDFTVTPATGPG
jgi:hypothetical protein